MLFGNRLRSCHAFIGSLLVLAAAPVAVAQEAQLDPDSFYGKDSTQGVYVRDSAVALEKFAHAQRMERLKEWDKSADLYQEILEKYPDRVVPSRTDADNHIQQYTSVALAAMEHVARWPREGLDVYRNRYEPAAATMLEAASRDDLSTLHRVFSRYFSTDAGRQAALRLISLYFESGEFAGAAWLGDRLLSLHPSLQTERAAVLYRTALAHHLSGDTAAAALKLEELRRHHANETGVVRGEDVILADSLDAELKIPPPTPTASRGDSWPMLGGAPDRGRISSASGRPGAKIYDVDLVPKPPRIANRDQRIAWEQQQEQDRQQGLDLGILPVADRGELFFQDNARVYAVGIDSGFPLPGWAETHGGERHGQYVIDAHSMPRGRQLSITLTDNAVLAIMGYKDHRLGPGNAEPHDTRLVCLDRSTGKERWSALPRNLPESASALRTLHFDGSPVVIDNSVYITGRGAKGAQFDDGYVLSFDLATGELQWHCYVASGNTSSRVWGDAAVPSGNISHLAYSSGRLYVLTNLGALAAIDAHSGTILWLNIYPRDVVDPDRAFIQRRARIERSTAVPKPWAYNPVIIHEGKVFILPADGRHLLVYDAGHGTELKRINLADLDTCDTLLGLKGDWMVLAGEHRLLCIEWDKYDPKRPASSRDMIVWRQQFKPAIRGRCFLTDDLIYVPTAERLFRVRFDTSGLIRDNYPENPRPWDREEGPGNVLVANNNVIIAGATRVDVYTDMDVARAKLDAEIAAAPDDPNARLRYAETMFSAGQLDVATARLDEAADLLGGYDALRPGEARNRLFNVTQTFAHKLMLDSNPQTMTLIGELFDRAAQAASSPAQQVSYRIRRARFAHKKRDFGGVARLHQEILADPTMRIVPMMEEDGQGATTAGKMATIAIDELIRRVGPSPYAPFETQAEQALAGAGEDADRLLEVARTFPNARISRHALILAAQAYENDGDSRTAAGVLRQIPKRSDAGDADTVTEALTRNYLKLGKYEVAIKQLANGKSAAPNARIASSILLPDETDLKDMTFANAEAVLRAYKAETAAPRRLVDLHLPGMPTLEQRQAGQRHPPTPFSYQFDDAIAGIESLLIPVRGFERHDRVVVWTTDQRLAVFAAGSKQPLGGVAGLASIPQRIAWTDDGCATWSDNELLLLDENGSSLWKQSLGDLPDAAILQTGMESRSETRASANLPANANINPALVRRRLQMPGAGAVPAAVPDRINPLSRPTNDDDEEETERITHVIPIDNLLILAASTGRIAAIHAEDGSLAWQTRLPGNAIDRIVASDDFVVVKGDDVSGADLIALDAFSGDVVARQTFGDDPSMRPVNFALARDGTLVFTLPDRICGMDLFQPGEGLTFQQPAQGGNRLFQNASHPDHLVIADGRILALSDNGQFIRLYSLATGRVLTYTPPESRREIEAMLSTGANDPGVSLRVAGSYLYSIGQTAVRAYNLDRPEPAIAAERSLDARESTIRDAILGEHYLLLLDSMKGVIADRRPALPGYRLLAYSRERVSGGESGLLVFNPIISDPAGIVQWQAVDGGLYYRSADKKLHFLRGAKPREDNP